MIQSFTCKGCKTTGSVRVSLDEGVWSVYQKIMQKHRDLQPRCLASLDQITVHIPWKTQRREREVKGNER
jgi:hypothetical protein